LGVERGDPKPAATARGVAAAAGRAGCRTLVGAGATDRIIVTHGAEAVGDARPLIDPEMQAWLDVARVERFRGFGTLVVGWVVDPCDTVSAVSIGAGSAEPIEIGAHAALLRPPECYEVFDIPRSVAAAKYGFVLRVDDPATDGPSGLILEVRFRSGEVQRCVLPLAVTPPGLEELLARAPVSYGLAVLRHMLAGWRAVRPRFEELPKQITALATAVQQKIDPSQNYGGGGNGAVVEGQVERVLRVGNAGLVVAGWLLHDDSDWIRDVAAVSLFGHRVDLDTPLPAVARPDIAEARGGQIASRNRDCGFVAFAAVSNLASDDRAWFLEFVTEAGVVKRIPFVCPAAPEPLHGIRASLAFAQQTVRDLPELFERVISPSADWFWARTREDNPHPTELVYGNPPTRAAISIIVPLYGRIDLMRYQIACFSNDPEFAASAARLQLIYVLDDPTAADEARLLSRHLYELYGLPFRMTMLQRNLGYSAANNAGAAAATGSLLLFLNSDVLPIRPGWVGELADTYRALDRCAVLGCRLLFEDGSMQHAGMTFRASALLSGCWENDHPGKGLPVTFDPHRGPAAVPAVTGACLLVDRDLFRELGGMSEDYVIADFEDSDFCLRAQEQGWRVYYTPKTELFHLERQSMQLIAEGEAGWRQSVTLYNMWKHSRRWAPLIPQVLDRLGHDDSPSIRRRRRPEPIPAREAV
jgi:O-antigen biosynthesis protein